jgi:hypothetical protein
MNPLHRKLQGGRAIGSSISANVAFALAMRICSACLAFLATIVAARALGPAAQGTYSSTIFIWTAAVGIYGLGISWTNAAFVVACC